MALVCLLSTEVASNLIRRRSLTNPTQIWRVPPDPATAEDKKEAAYTAAKAALTKTLVGPNEAKWAPYEQSGFQKTREGNFIAVAVEVTNGRRERVLEHWIVRLEPKTNHVLSQVCKEETHALGSLTR